MAKTSFDLIYSIGEDCACAIYLDKSKLRTVSGPFDWLTNASFQTRIQLILNNFDAFIEEEDLVLLAKDTTLQNDKDHNYFENKRNDFYFYHDFSSHLPLKDSFPKIKEKYQRRIHLFYQKIHRKERVLFIWMSHTKKIDNETLKNAAMALKEKFNKPIHLLVIEHSDAMKNGEYHCYQIDPSVTKYVLYTQSRDKNGNLETLGNVENCILIFRKFSYYRPILFRGINILIPLVAHIAALFIRDKETRRRVRKFQLN